VTVGGPRALCVAFCLATFPALAPWAAAEECAVPDEMVRAEVALPHLQRRLKRAEPVRIVALGGGSTAGAAARNPALAYPHRLEEALARHFPAARITVVNKGVPRQTAQQMLDRFPADVIAEHPALVIWEAGVTDAVRGDEIDGFAAALQRGLDRLKAHGIDAMLMDMQFSHKAETVIDFDKYLGALHRIADVNGIYLFPRFAMMRYWSERHMFNFDEVAKAERAGLAAKVYQCIGRRLAEAIAAAVR
jgi:acyl-CoA thioesterase I